LGTVQFSTYPKSQSQNKNKKLDKFQFSYKR
jgi:hypothetical protein